MNRVFLLLAGLCLALTGWGQNDTTQANKGNGAATPADDTIHVGNLLIVRNGNTDWDDQENHRDHRHHNNYKPSRVSTNWVMIDLGFANYNDRTNYASAGTQQFAPGSTKDWFGLNTGKSVDVNIWLFMQRLSLYKNVINLKYGLGIELNNYRYEEDIRYHINPTQVVMDSIHYSKNKLATDYVTIPVMLNFNFTPHRRYAYGFSAGVSFGYKYSSRQKFKSDETGKTKTFNSFDLNPWKISYVGELTLGWLKLYGSYATQSIFSKGLNQIPYNIGLRLGNW